MSFTDFKEVNINNPGTSAFYGSDDLNEVMRIFNAKVVSNRRVRIKNPWQFQDNYDIVAAAVVPGNPGANTKRFYVDPADNHFKMKSTSGAIVDYDVLAASAFGETNTASNVGGSTGSQGFFKAKSGVDLQFRKLNAASNKLTVALDTTNDEIDIDANETNFTLQNMSGLLNVARGGTGVNTFPTNSLLKGNASGAIANIATGTDGHILTMVGGAPTWASSTASADTKAVLFEAGTQIGTVGRRLNYSNPNDFTITEDTTNDRFDIATVRSEVLVASWINPSSDSFIVATGAFANVNTTYRDAFAVGGDGVGTDVDGTGKREFRFYVSWHKNAGVGVHSIKLVAQAAPTNTLAEIPALVTGRNAVTGTIPAYFQDIVRPVKLQMKASNATDDPILRAAYLYYK